MTSEEKKLLQAKHRLEEAHVTIVSDTTSSNNNNISIFPNMKIIIYYVF